MRPQKTELQILLEQLGFKPFTGNLYKHDICGVVPIDTINDVVHAIYNNGKKHKSNEIKQAL
jgi:hypothetical protein